MSRLIYLNYFTDYRIAEFEKVSHDMATFKAYLMKSSKLMLWYKRFGDEQSLELVATHRETLEGLRQGLGMDKDGKVNKDDPSTFLDLCN